MSPSIPSDRYPSCGPKWLVVAVSAMALGVLMLAACGRDENAPYLEFAGGGFLFNYRLAEASYGFIARVRRPLPQGAVLEARFENPAGGDPFVVTQPARSGLARYTFNSPAVQGVQAGRDYTVELRVLDHATRQPVASYQKTFRADLDQSILPEKPPVVGPGYTTNPGLSKRSTAPD